LLALFILETDYIKVQRFLRIKVTSSIKLDIVPIQFRFGYFTCTQKQPAMGLFTYNDKPSIMDLNLKTEGLVFRLVTINEEHQGLNINWHAKLFSKTSMKTAAYDLFKAKFNSDASSSYVALGFDSWYNLKLSSSASLTLGLNSEVNAYFVWDPQESEGDDENEVNDDMAWRLRQWPTDLYVRFVYKF